LCENCQKLARRGLPHAFGDTKPESHNLLGWAGPLSGRSPTATSHRQLGAEGLVWGLLMSSGFFLRQSRP